MLAVLTGRILLLAYPLRCLTPVPIFLIKHRILLNQSNSPLAIAGTLAREFDSTVRELLSWNNAIIASRNWQVRKVFPSVNRRSQRLVNRSASPGFGERR